MEQLLHFNMFTKPCKKIEALNFLTGKKIRFNFFPDILEYFGTTQHQNLTPPRETKNRPPPVDF